MERKRGVLSNALYNFSPKGGEISIMEKRRMEEIALALWRWKASEESFRFSDIKEGLDDLVEETGLPREELKEFERIILQEQFDKAFEA